MPLTEQCAIFDVYAEGIAAAFCGECDLALAQNLQVRANHQTWYTVNNGIRLFHLNVP